MRIRRTLYRAGLVGFTLVAGATIAGAIYQVIGQAEDLKRFPPPGRLVSVGPYRLHLHCTGEGEPTVLLEALAGGLSAQWAWVQPLVAETTRVCSYDRAGRGWSDGAPARDLWGTVEDLHALLQNAGVSGPLVLVGHSIGGLYVRAYADRYPDDVLGLVLIDSSHPEQYDRYPELRASAGIIPFVKPIFPWLARVGLFRYYFSTGGEIDFGGLPPQEHAEMAAFWSSPRYFENSAAEFELVDLIYEQAHELPARVDAVLAVVSAGRQPASWSALQRDLKSLSDTATHMTVEDATHSSLVFHPEHAKMVAEAIEGVVQEVRGR